MKLGIFFILCCIGVSLTNPSNTDQVSKDLSDLESVHLQGLVNVAQQGEVGSAKARQVYYEKYTKTLVSIDKSDKYIIKDNVIHFNYDLAEDFFKSFGYYIWKLEIDYRHIPADKQKSIGKLIGEYGSETLQELNVKSFKNGAFDDIEKPFDAVQKVTFDGEWKDASNKKWTFDKLFPKINHLILYGVGGDVYKNHLESVKEFQIFRPTTNEFREFIKKNPQIKKLQFRESSMEDLKIISETLKLERLSFKVPSDSTTYDGPEIELGNIQDVKIIGRENKITPQDIKFNEIVELRLVLSGNIGDEYVNFIGNIETIKGLTVDGGTFKKSTLDKLTESLKSVL